MLESFMVAFNAVMPLLLLLGIGYGAVRLKITDRAFMDRLNALNFRLFFPFMMFNNIYNAKPENLPSATLMIAAPAAILVLIVLLVLLVPRFVKENPRRGVIIQACFRSNFIIYGIPLTTYVFGTEKSSVCGMMVMIVVSLFNIAAVVILETFREGGNVRLKPLLLGIVKNRCCRDASWDFCFMLSGFGCRHLFPRRFLPLQRWLPPWPWWCWEPTCASMK